MGAPRQVQVGVISIILIKRREDFILRKFFHLQPINPGEEEEMEIVVPEAEHRPVQGEMEAVMGGVEVEWPSKIF